MTVAAVILSATAEGALTDTLGQPRVRRLVDIAWSGGALPVVVVAPESDGAVASALIGSEATYGSPAPAETGPVGQMLRGAEVAQAEVAETSALLLWPARMTWVGPETITSMIEAHGTDPSTLIQPGWQGEAGWPVLLPLSALRVLGRLGAELMPHEIVAALAGTIPTRILDVGDPGVHYDADTPLADLPPYEGPPEPPGGHRHEWGDAVTERGADEDVPGEGRGLAPFPQAADETAVDPG